MGMNKEVLKMKKEVFKVEKNFKITLQIKCLMLRK